MLYLTVRSAVGPTQIDHTFVGIDASSTDGGYTLTAREGTAFCTMQWTHPVYRTFLILTAVCLLIGLVHVAMSDQNIVRMNRLWVGWNQYPAKAGE